MPRFDANWCAPLGCLGPTPELLTPVLLADGFGERERSSTPSVYAAMPVAHLVCVPEPDSRFFMRRRGPSAHRTHMSLTEEPQLDGVVTFARHEAGPQFSVAVEGHRCRGLGQTDHSCMSHRATSSNHGPPPMRACCSPAGPATQNRRFSTSSRTNAFDHSAACGTGHTRLGVSPAKMRALARHG